MEITYPSSHCKVNGAHYYIEAVSLSGIFQCKHCKAVKWQPVYWSDAVKMSDLVKRHGLDKAYTKSLQHRSKTRHIMESLMTNKSVKVSAEVRQELRKENIESLTQKWTTTEMGEGVVSGRQKRMKRKRLV